MIAACTRKKEWTGPKFTGRLLVVAEEFDGTDSDLIEITPGANSTYNQTVITSGVFSATASPDQTRLLYTTRDGIFLRDLSKGTVKKLAPGADGGNYCLAWSPDSNRFSFRSSEGPRRAERAHLYVSDLDGKTKQIWETWSGAVNPSCDVHWIAPDRLIFDRFLGASEYERAGEIVSENTTTVAILGDPVKFVDTDKKWSIDAVCQFGNAAVVRPQHKDYPVSIAKSLDNLKTLNPSPVSCSSCRFVGFAAKSCVPFFLETDNKTTDIFSLNTMNGQRQRAARINRVFSGGADNMMISSSARLMVVGSDDSLFLVDTESGDVEPFFPKSFDSILNKKIIGIEPIVWLEK